MALGAFLGRERGGSELREVLMQNAYFCFDDYVLADAELFREAVMGLRVGFVNQEEAKDV